MSSSDEKDFDPPHLLSTDSTPLAARPITPFFPLKSSGDEESALISEKNSDNFRILKNKLDSISYLISEDEFSFLSSLTFRYLSSNEVGKEFRDSWIENLLPSVEKYNLNYLETYPLSSSSGNFDLLIIGGNDSRQISRFLKQNEAIISSKPRIILMNNSDPRRRAQALNAGFDDVLDSVRMSVSEALFRLIAICRRYQITKENKLKNDMMLREVNQIVTPDANLSNTELRILKLLLKNFQKVVSYSSLESEASKGYEPISRSNLKVVISKLRKKILRDYLITASGGYGYVIKKIE